VANSDTSPSQEQNTTRPGPAATRRQTIRPARQARRRAHRRTHSNSNGNHGPGCGVSQGAAIAAAIPSPPWAPHRIRRPPPQPGSRRTGRHGEQGRIAGAHPAPAPARLWIQWQIQRRIQWRLGANPLRSKASPQNAFVLFDF